VAIEDSQMDPSHPARVLVDLGGGSLEDDEPSLGGGAREVTADAFLAAPVVF